MFTWRQFTLLGLAASAVIAACPSRVTHPVSATHSPSLAMTRGDLAAPQATTPKPIGRVPLRESPLSTFYNAEYEVSFRYPRNYALEEGNILEHSLFLKRQEDVDAEEPGARLIATVLIPDDAYPNTNFLHGSLQVLVKGSPTRESCKQILPDGKTSESETRSLRIQDPKWDTFETHSKFAGTELLERDFFSFSKQVCYEFLLVVASDDPSDGVELKQADLGRVMHQLERIIASSQFYSPTQTLIAHSEK